MKRQNEEKIRLCFDTCVLDFEIVDASGLSIPNDVWLTLMGTYCSADLPNCYEESFRFVGALYEIRPHIYTHRPFRVVPTYGHKYTCRRRTFARIIDSPYLCGFYVLWQLVITLIEWRQINILIQMLYLYKFIYIHVHQIGQRISFDTFCCFCFLDCKKFMHSKRMLHERATPLSSWSFFCTRTYLHLWMVLFYIDSCLHLYSWTNINYQIFTRFWHVIPILQLL